MKIRTFKMILILTLFITTKCFGQNFEPIELAKQIFEKDSFNNIHNYVTGEYEGRPNKGDFPKGTITKFLLLEQKEEKAVVSMTILDSMGQGVDTYLFFKKDTIWKMSAFRLLALTGMIEQANRELESLNRKQVKDIIKSAKKNKKEGESSIFNSMEEYKFELGNTKLTIELDEKIIEHFKKNKNEFERIKNLVLNEIESTEKQNERQRKVGESLRLAYRKLFISSITSGDYEFKNGLNFVIGGITDNTVGYVYFKDKKDIPQMDASGIIMLREIGNGWYIYKTT